MNATVHQDVKTSYDGHLVTSNDFAESVQLDHHLEIENDILMSLQVTHHHAIVNDHVYYVEDPPW